MVMVNALNIYSYGQCAKHLWLQLKVMFFTIIFSTIMFFTIPSWRFSATSLQFVLVSGGLLVTSGLPLGPIPTLCAKCGECECGDDEEDEDVEWYHCHWCAEIMRNLSKLLVLVTCSSFCAARFLKTLFIDETWIKELKGSIINIKLVKRVPPAVLRRRLVLPQPKDDF